MNTVILRHIRNLLEATIGSYFELGADTGENVSVLSNNFTDRIFISVDSDSNNYNTINSNIFNHANVLFYSMSAAEYNRTLTDAVALSYGISVIFINHGADYEDYAESVKIAQRLLGINPGHVVINQANATPDIINEFHNLLGYRIVKETLVTDTVVSYQIREQ